MTAEVNESQFPKFSFQLIGIGHTITPSNANYSVVFQFLVRRDESPENYCHSPGVVGGVGGVVRRQKL